MQIQADRGRMERKEQMQGRCLWVQVETPDLELEVRVCRVMGEEVV